MSAGSPPPGDDAVDVPLGGLLRAMRKSAGLTGQQLGVRAGMSQAKISRIETGAIVVEADDVRALGRALDITATELQRLLGLALRADTRMTEWRTATTEMAVAQREIGEFEEMARDIRGFQPAVIFGLLQTSEYARAIMTIFQDRLSRSQGRTTPGTVSEAVSARMRRHEILASPHRRFRFVLAEAVFSNRLTRPAVMLAQIDRIREVAQQDNVDVRIIPADAVLTVPLFHGFDLYDDRCVSVDLFNVPVFSLVRSDVLLYGHVFDELEGSSTADIQPILDGYFDRYLELTAESRTSRADQPG